MVYLCHYYGLSEVADYWEGVIKINDYQKERFIMNMLNAMFNTLAGKKICLFGFAFKADTGDTRESPAIYITQRLAEEHAHIFITDPKALDNARIDLKNVNGRIDYISDPYLAASGCDAIAIMTEWKIYKELDYEKIYASMSKPAFIFDGRNISDHSKLFELGFNVYPIGKPALTHFQQG